jgi:TonB family protein
MLTRVIMQAGIATLAAVFFSGGCNKGGESDQPFSGVGARPDVLPVMLNRDLPFRYPPSLYAKKVQANVTLRVFIDKEGQVVGESTHVAESSGIPSLDSAAVKGSGELRFIPAKTRGDAVPVSILFPVYFRHPDAPPLPGDTILKKTGVAAIPNTQVPPRDISRTKASVDSLKSSPKASVGKQKASKNLPSRPKR